MSTTVAVKRITKDLRDLQKDSLETSGIFYVHDDVDFLRGRALVIGPDDTPYQMGYYFFDFYYPEEYPFKPPRVVFQTRQGTIRFNPNLYACGKVCVSILNTWSGPQWTACQSIRSVLLSLQSLLNSHPLQNEPGFENDVGERSQCYNKIISYENVRFAILTMLEKPPPGFKLFQDTLTRTFKNNFSKILRFVLDTKKSYGDNNPYELIRSPIYGMKLIIDWNRVLQDLLSSGLKFGLELDKTIVESSKKTIHKKKIKRRLQDIDASVSNKIKITKTAWKSLSIDDMMKKKTVTLLKKHIVSSKIQFDSDHFGKNPNKQNLCQIIWEFYQGSESNKKTPKPVKVNKHKLDTVDKVDTVDNQITKVAKLANTIAKKKYQKSTPSTPAKLFPVGSIHQSDNSEHTYQVCKKSNEVLYWKKIKITPNTNTSQNSNTVTNII